jgi:adenylate cyclase, class 2
MPNSTENEVKIRVSDRAATLDQIRAAGFHESVSRLFEANTLYDTPDKQLRQKEMLLRLREAGDRSVITWKGRGVPGPHKSRPEIETTLGSAETMAQIFHELGLDPVFRYEKYRTEFSHAKTPGVVTLDETPIGDFLELEGPPAWIDETAKMLGFSSQEYILDSYVKLYIADCERRGVQPTHMIFATPPG